VAEPSPVLVVVSLTLDKLAAGGDLQTLVDVTLLAADPGYQLSERTRAVLLGARLLDESGQMSSLTRDAVLAWTPVF
jgi:hypothetical protein